MLKIKCAAAVFALALAMPALSSAQAATWHHHRHYVRSHHHYYHTYHRHHYYRGHYSNYSNRNEFACTLPKSSQAYEPCMNRH